MIDFETVRFLGILNKLARKTKNPFIAFSDICHDDYEGVYIHENEELDYRECIIYDDKKGEPDNRGDNSMSYPIVLDMCVDELHHDIVSYYDESYMCYEPHLIVIDDKNIFIEITRPYDNESIIIENGEWYGD